MRDIAGLNMAKPVWHVNVCLHIGVSYTIYCDHMFCPLSTIPPAAKFFYT